MSDLSKFIGFDFSQNAVYIAQIYQNYLKNKQSVDASWIDFFNSLADSEVGVLKDIIKGLSVVGNKNELISIPPEEIKAEEDKKSKQEQLVKDALKKGGYTKAGTTMNITTDLKGSVETEKYLREIYQRLGHLQVTLDPLGLQKRTSSELEALKSALPQSEATFINRFESIYANDIAAEFTHLNNKNERDWLTKNFEQTQTSSLTSIEQKTALEYMFKSEMFENYLHTKFPGAKRFSVEGGEGYIPCLEEILAKSAQSNVKQIVIGMAHRGRLNTLVHTMGKPYHALFSEFMGIPSVPEGIPGAGDVKYHLGFSRTRKTTKGDDIYVTLTPNPSHLESVNTVVMGRVRAKQDLLNDRQQRKVVMGILIHGDAAMIGQGIVAEGFNMSNTAGYTVGGIVHIAINNQIGFTAISKDSRSSEYCTDIAKTSEVPIFHVNASNVDAVLKVAKLATDYRNTFGKDVCIDLVCYRKYGHNEGDEPMFTQPTMYNVIKSLKTPAELYATKLQNAGLISASEIEAIKTKIKTDLDAEYEIAKSYKPTKADWLDGEWKDITYLKDKREIFNLHKTAISEEDYSKFSDVITSVPQGFHLNKKIERLFGERKTALSSGTNIDWATGELLAYCGIVNNGSNVRLSGEDCERGTFSHRQSVVYDQETNQSYNILSPLFKDGRYEVYNSVLSEFGVLGFEYGYSLTTPKPLVIWEAQFGDFANGATTIYDQYISSGEDKWLRMSGLVSLLPHGYEGQGPEHSSARLERYLQYCANNNIIVANCTTPANFFHILRRQISGSVRKPLVVMTPKSLLRHPMAVSKKDEFIGKSHFQTIIGDINANYKAENIIFTSGKIYYDLIAKQQELKNTKTAIIRIEQYYPFDDIAIKSELAKYKSAKKFVWVQEESRNMGAWSFIRDHLEDATGERIKYIGRAESASPATGFASVHKKEQEAVLLDAFSI